MLLPSSFLRARALVLVLACAGLSVPALNAVVVTVGSQDYNVSTIYGSYAAHAATLQSQVWWGDESTASSFASAVGDQLGLPNSAAIPFSPLYVFGTDQVANWLYAYVAEPSGSSSYSVQSYEFLSASQWTFAVATPVNSIGVPDSGASLALLGLSLAGLMALRRRLA